MEKIKNINYISQGGGATPVAFGFYEELKKFFSARSLDIVYTPICERAWRDRLKIQDLLACTTRTSINFNHHTHLDWPGNINFKQGWLPATLFIDQGGYSQFHSLAKCSKLPEPLLDDVDRSIGKIVVEEYLSSGLSKYKQMGVNELALPSNYILFPLQNPNDISLTGVGLSGMLEALKFVYHWCEVSGVTLVVKEHPDTVSWGVDPARKNKNHTDFRGVIDNFKAEYSRALWHDGNIRQLVLGSSAVVCINSGVGFEALVLGRPVVALGPVCYSHATVSCLSAINAFDPDYSRKFVEYYLTYHTFSRHHDLGVLFSFCLRYFGKHWGDENITGFIDNLNLPPISSSLGIIIDHLVYSKYLGFRKKSYSMDLPR